MSKQKQVQYLSADLDYLHASFEKVAQFTYQEKGDSLKTSYSDTIGIHRKTFTFSLNYGLHYYLKQLEFDINFGIGLRYRNISHSNKLHQDGIWLNRLEPSLPDKLFVNGDYFTLSIPLNLKIGYRFQA